MKDKSMEEAHRFHAFQASSPSIYGKRYHDSVLFRVGALLHPFTLVNKITQSPPAICTSCGAFISKFVTFDNENRNWICNFCGTINRIQSLMGSLTNDTENIDTSNIGLQKEFTEDFSDTIETLNYDPIEEHLVTYSCTFAIDLRLCLENSFLTLLHQSLSSLSPDTIITILFFDHVLNILRLNTVTSSISCDVLPGDRDFSFTLSHFMERGYYSSPVKLVLERWTVIQTTLHSLANTSRIKKSRSQADGQCTITLTALIGFARTLVRQRRRTSSRLSSLAEDHSFSRLLLFTGTSLATGSGNLAGHGDSNDRSSRRHPSVLASGATDPAFSVAEGLGAAALASGCWIDAFALGIEAIDVAVLVAAVQVSGGQLVSAASLDEAEGEVFRDGILEVVGQRRQSFPSFRELAILDIRAAPSLLITDVLGPVIRDSLLQHLLETQPPYVAENLLETAAHSVGQGGAGLEGLSRSVEDASAKAVVRSYLGRCDPAACVSIAVKPTGSDGDRVARAGGGVRTCLQVVVRFSSWASRGVVHRVTRVCTFGFLEASEPQQHLAAMDAAVWAVVTGRALVADAHEALCYTNAFPSATVVTDAESANETEVAASRIRRISVDAVDALAREVGNGWLAAARTPDSPLVRKARDVLRFLFSLREGPLLMGPAMDAQQSFVLRTGFLRCPLVTAKPLLRPSLQILPLPLPFPSKKPSGRDFVNESGYKICKNTGGFEASKNPSSPPPSQPPPSPQLPSFLSLTQTDLTTQLVSVPPEWAWLCLAQFAIVDTGDIILVWEGSNHTPELGMEGRDLVVRALLEMARERAYQRQPRPLVELVRAERPQERLVLARLSPTVCEADFDTMGLGWVSGDGEDEATERLSWALLQVRDGVGVARAFPHTDQPSFRRYLTSVAPKLMNDTSSTPTREGHPSLATGPSPVTPLPPINRDSEDGSLVLEGANETDKGGSTSSNSYVNFVYHSFFRAKPPVSQLSDGDSASHSQPSVIAEPPEAGNEP